MQAILQVAIGLIFIFSLLSILVTTVNSIVTNLLRTRTRYLKMGVNSLLTDPELQASFLSHPLVKLVQAPMMVPGSVATAQQAEQAAAAMNNAALTRLTWIDPKIFSEVLISLLREKSELSLFGPLIILVDALPPATPRDRLLNLIFGVQTTGTGITDLRAAIMALPHDLQPPLLTALEPIEARFAVGGETTGAALLFPVLEGIRKVNDAAFRRAMKVIVGSARSLDEAQRQIESWFNARMDQVSGLYQQRLGFFSILIGIVLVVVLNVDALNIGKTLWEEPTRRAAVTAAAEQAVRDGTLAIPAAPTPAPEATPDPSAPDAVASAQSADPDPDFSAVQDFEATLNALLTLDVPIGWAYLPVEGGCFLSEGTASPPACSSELNLWAHLPGNSPEWGGLFVRKLLGMIITIIAVAQGAPFWFDLLNRLVRGK